MKTRTKILLALALYLGITILLGALFGSAGKNEEFKPQNEFKLEAWIPIKIGGIDLSINRAVFYLLLATGLTIATMVWISRRMQQKPNRVQTAVEVAYDLTRTNITGGNMDTQYGHEVVPLRRHALLLHLVLEHDRLPAAADQHRERDPHLRAGSAHLGDLRGDRQRLGPAGAHPGGLGHLQRRGHPLEGVLSVLRQLASAGIGEHEPASARPSSS